MKTLLTFTGILAFPNLYKPGFLYLMQNLPENLTIDVGIVSRGHCPANEQHRPTRGTGTLVAEL